MPRRRPSRTRRSLAAPPQAHTAHADFDAGRALDAAQAAAGALHAGNCLLSWKHLKEALRYQGRAEAHLENAGHAAGAAAEKLAKAEQAVRNASAEYSIRCRK